MQDAIRSALQLLNYHLGLDIESSIVPYLVLLFTIAGTALTLRRRLKDLRLISSKMEESTITITNRTTQEFASLLGTFRTLNEDLKGTVNARMDELRVFLRPTDSVEAQPNDPDVDADALSKLTPKTRLDWAAQARDAVVAKWLDGRDLKPSSDDANIYEYNGKNPAGQTFKLKFSTPYRTTAETDSRLPFALDLWVDNRKKLNFEWDTDGKYALRGFTKGEWFEDISHWHLVAEQAPIHDRRVA